jgi:glycosyltransferase involved in cell wall biosynthesis
MNQAATASVVTHQPDFRALSKIEAVGIVIPARNQSDEIAQCVRSIFAANSQSGWRNSLWIVVVADACTDTTAKVARDAIGAFGEVLQVAARSLQTAHQIGVDAVMEHFRRVPRHALLLCSADAGTDLRRDWIDGRLRRSHPSVRAAAG